MLTLTKSMALTVQAAFDFFRPSTSRSLTKTLVLPAHLFPVMLVRIEQSLEFHKIQYYCVQNAVTIPLISLQHFSVHVSTSELSLQSRTSLHI
jgi:hypothetical protein